MKEINNPIFIVGAPRTGTTLTREILSLHSKIFLYNETHFFESVYARGKQNKNITSQKLNEAIEVMINRNNLWKGTKEFCHGIEKDDYLKKVQQEGVSYKNILKIFLSIQAASRNKVIWGDSTPQDILFIKEIITLFPESRIIGLIRDPRDYLASNKNYYRKNIAHYAERYDPIINSLLWKSYMNKLLKAKKDIVVKDQIYLISYERLVDNPLQEVKALCEWLKIDFEDNMINVDSSNSSYLPNKNTVKGINKNSLGKWKSSLEPFEIFLTEIICKKEMIELNYLRSNEKFMFNYIFKITQVILKAPLRIINRFRVNKKFSFRKILKTLKIS